MTSRRVEQMAALVLAALLATAPVAVARDDGAVAAAVRVNPLSVTLEVSATSVGLGNTIDAKAKVTNGGSEPVQKIAVELRFDRAGFAVRRGAERSIGQIKGGKTASVAWSICAVAPGSYLVLAQATAGGATVESTARIVTVIEGGRRSC